MSEITSRRANDNDIAAQVELYREFHEFHVRDVPDRLRIPERYDDDHVRQLLIDLLHDAGAALFVAENAAPGVLVGLTEVYLKHDKPNPAAVAYTHGYLHSLMVTESMHGQGIGRQLVQAAHHWATDHGAPEMRLNTWEFAAGPQAFYEAIGYRTLRRTLVRPMDSEG